MGALSLVLRAPPSPEFGECTTEALPPSSFASTGVQPIETESLQTSRVAQCDAIGRGYSTGRGRGVLKAPGLAESRPGWLSMQVHAPDHHDRWQSVSGERGRPWGADVALRLQPPRRQCQWPG